MIWNRDRKMLGYYPKDKKMRKTYYLLFYKLYRFFKAISNDSWSDWKAGIVIQATQIFFILIILFQIIIYSKKQIYYQIVKFGLFQQHYYWLF